MQDLEARSLLTALIALVDTGVDLTPTDSSYISDSPYYDLAAAYNAYDGTSNVADNNGHGTQVANAIVAGIQAAMSAPGAAGASVKILPIRDTNPSGQLDIDSIINGICYAANEGAAVINLSFASTSNFVSASTDTLHPSMSLSQAIQYAQSKGSVVVVAAGNSGNIVGGVQYGNQDVDIETPYPVQPAAMGHDDGLTNEIVTAAFNTSTDALQSDSNYGPVHVAVAAPGSETSFAAGYLSGVAGVVAALRPNFTDTQIINQIVNTVQPVASLQGLVGSGGVVNPSGAVSGLVATNLRASASVSTPSVSGTTVTLGAQVSGMPAGGTASYQWQTISAPAGAASPTFSVNGSAAAAGTTATLAAAGAYTFEVTATDGLGDSATATVSTTVVPTLTSIAVAEASTSVADGATDTFSATGDDQFHHALSPQPALTWSVSGSAGGSITQGGVYTAPTTGSGSETITAASAALTGSASVTVTSPAAAVNMSAQSLGQDGVDLVGNGGWSSDQPGGYQNIDILLSGIPSNQTISYIDVLGYGGGEWQYNWQNGPSPHGSDFAALVRTPGATTAHLYVSPYQNETGRTYQVVVYLADGVMDTMYTNPVYATYQLPMPAATSLGQDGVDLVGNGGWSSDQPDGYQDVDILLTGIPAAQTISYIDVLGYGGGEWQYNWQNGPSPHGSDFAALVRTPGSTSAHLYVQPYQHETGRTYQIIIDYANGVTVNLYSTPVYALAKLPDV